MSAKFPQTTHNQRGATLIEALVAILVLSLGMLGMAGLQLNALSFQKSSWALHRVSELTIDINERMQSNANASQNGFYNYQPTYAVAAVTVLPSTGCKTSTSTVVCTPKQIADDDLSEWLAKAQRNLPGGAGSISGNATEGFVVTAMYADKDFRDATTNAPSASATCTASTAGNAWRSCCPASASVPAGVRCSRTPMLVYIPNSLALP